MVESTLSLERTFCASTSLDFCLKLSLTVLKCELIRECDVCVCLVHLSH